MKLATYIILGDRQLFLFVFLSTYRQTPFAFRDHELDYCNGAQIAELPIAHRLCEPPAFPCACFGHSQRAVAEAGQQHIRVARTTRGEEIAETHCAWQATVFAEGRRVGSPEAVWNACERAIQYHRGKQVSLY